MKAKAEVTLFIEMNLKETIVLQKLLGSMTKVQVLQLGLSEDEYEIYSNIYASLPMLDSFIED